MVLNGATFTKPSITTECSRLDRRQTLNMYKRSEQYTGHRNRANPSKKTDGETTGDKGLLKPNLKILGLNVCGLISKLNLSILEDYIFDNLDIVCLSETKTDQIDEVNANIGGFKPFFHHRKNFVRKSGGIVTFITESIAQHAKVLSPSENEFVQWIKIDENVLGYGLIIAATYIPPPDSPYSTGHEHDQIMQDLIDIQSNYNDYKVCIIGDMNSRTANQPDFVEVDEHLLEATGLTECLSDLFVNEHNLEKLDIPKVRYNEDKTLDNNGRKLIEFCKNTGMLIVNGRVGKREETGRLTCKKSSTVDYAIASIDLFPHINDFCIDTFDRCLSDVHCPITLELNQIISPMLNISETEVEVEKNEPTKATPNTKINWEQNKKDLYTNSFKNAKILELVGQIDNLDEKHKTVTQVDIDHITKSIENIYKEAGETAEVIKTTPQNHKKHYRNQTHIRKTCKKAWFNDECNQKRKEFFLAKNKYKKEVNPTNKAKMNSASKNYRKTVKRTLKNYHYELHKNLRTLKSNNPKDYWGIINKAHGSTKKTGEISIDTFMQHFKTLNTTPAPIGSPIRKQGRNEAQPTNEGTPHITLNTQYNEGDAGEDLPFNHKITEAELRFIMKKLKNGKAGGVDQIINEFIKNSPPSMLTLICSYFNLILDIGMVPESWTVGLIVPIFKNKGNIDDADNYRGITLLCCMGKLFTMLINKRLQDYLEQNSLLGEEQTGFREGYSTLDHIFSLNCIIDLLLCQRKRLYCVFVDYKKAFDMVDRSSLWSKVLKLNIEGKVLTVIKNMYDRAKSCIKHNGKLSDFFACNVGVRQGENLSPLLFSIYLNDLQEHFTENCRGVTCKEGTDVLLRLFVLLYADDTILLSESVEDLQEMLHTLENYCEQWQLTVNTSKTKAVVFSRGKIKNLPTLTFKNQPLEVQYDYTYLGILFNYNGKFKKAIQKQAAQAKRALFSLLSKARKLQLPLDLQCHLFDACIVPILVYGCEVWGFSNISDIERVQSYFCKHVLRLNYRTANCIALGELGRPRLQCIVKQRMVQFWCKLAVGKSNKISSALFKIVQDKHYNGSLNSPWLTSIINMLNNCGLGYLLNSPPGTLNLQHTKSIVKNRTLDIETQEWHSQVTESGHCTNYRIFKTELHFEEYINILNPKETTDLCQFRCGNHKLPTTVGRHAGVEKSQRHCPLCKSKAIGDEYHYILECSAFQTERAALIDAKYLRTPNTLYMKSLFQSKDATTCSNLAKLCRIIMERFKRVGSKTASHTTETTVAETMAQNSQNRST